nr:hypothetical protein [Tanacetum cinerariifolium]
MALPPRDQRRQYLRFEGLQYTEGVIADFETRLDRIYRRKGLMVIALALPIIDITELVRLQICAEFRDTWAWVLTGPARQEGDAGGVDVEASMVPGGGVEDVKMPQAMPPPPRTQGERISILEEEVHGMREALQGQREVLDSMAHVFSRIKPGNKFSIVVHEYVTETSMLSKSRAELRRESVYKSVEAEEKSNLKFS